MTVNIGDKTRAAVCPQTQTLLICCVWSWPQKEPPLLSRFSPPSPPPHRHRHLCTPPAGTHLHPLPLLPPVSLRSLFAPEVPQTARGVQKHNPTPSKGQISHSACLWALGTKAAEFTSIKRALAFVPGNGGVQGGWGGHLERALHQTSPSWSALSGAAKRLARQPFD